ncbi:protein phosphatase 2 (formerly 2A), regulatory subunit B [Trypanosoma grayi]|uniref:protein phosphatase 2 (formerly 2A), regulatory subunit B n=1 Tax=Trypanosoma grayi TaxID=71804 RepID=UPI0004F45F6A|nr:protein phosphatase 2 (formerly 2A), regulatory subunit B [Trypanosoma grayi]KEG09978.1 protein phosphatase 2 (formerly 2A), regulatory subunit B [Trypanosoma grayi]
MNHGRLTTETVSSLLEHQKVLLNDGKGFGRNGTTASSISGFPNDGANISYRLGESGVGGVSPSPPSPQARRPRPQSAARYEGSDDWKQSPAYGGHRDGGYFSRSYGGSNGELHSQRYSEHPHGHSNSARRRYGENSSYVTEDGSDVNGSFLRSASFSASVAESSSSLLFSPSTRSTTHRSGSGTSAFRAVRGSADVPLLLASTLSEKQATRVRASLQNSGGRTQSGTRVKVLELLEYWMSDVMTGAAIERLIAEAFRDAGLTDGGTATTENGSSRGTDARIGTVKTADLRPRPPPEEDKPIRCDVTYQSSSSSSSSSGSLSRGGVEANRGEEEMRGNYNQPLSPSPSPSPPPPPQRQRQRQLQLQQQQQQRQLEGRRGGVESLRERDAKVEVTPAPSRSETPCAQRSPDAEPMVPSPRLPLPSPPLAAPIKVSPRAATVQAPVSRLVTYEDVPRFYFPKGAPQAEEETLMGPMRKKHDNPHLQVVEGMALPRAVYTAGEDRAAFMSSDVLPGRRTRAVPIAPLKAMNDKNVPHFLQKEFSRLPASPKPHHGTRPLSAHGKGFLGLSSGLQTRQGLNYRMQLTQAMQRICTQCFGLPKYFAYLLVRILQAETASGNAGTRTNRSSSSVALSAPTLLTGLPSSYQVHITAQQLRWLFETHLRDRCITRRVFEVLLLSSRTTTGDSKMAAESDNGSTTASTTELQQQGQQRSYLLPEDFRAYIEVLLEHHPGLAFLKQTPDFQARYMETVIYRIFYSLDRLDRGHITYAELENSSFLDAIRQVDATDDINSVLLYFSYEHFYVLYCRFWELDEDRDMLLSREDFMRYAPENVMNPIIADRTFNGVGRRAKCTAKNRINYEDFVWFCLSEEDKSTPTAIRYWFRILDLDGDGVLSMYELRIFYEATRKTVMDFVPDGAAAFEDVICQIFDMFGVEASCGLRLRDLLAKPEAAGVALNMVTNVVRFLQFEQKDPFVAHQERLSGGLEQTPWDRFARVEYDRMAQSVGNE